MFRFTTNAGFELEVRFSHPKVTRTNLHPIHMTDVIIHERTTVCSIVDKAGVEVASARIAWDNIKPRMLSKDQARGIVLTRALKALGVPRSDRRTAWSCYRAATTGTLHVEKLLNSLDDICQHFINQGTHPDYQIGARHAIEWIERRA